MPAPPLLVSPDALPPRPMTPLPPTSPLPPVAPPVPETPVPPSALLTKEPRFPPGELLPARLAVVPLSDPVKVSVLKAAVVPVSEPATFKLPPTLVSPLVLNPPVRVTTPELSEMVEFPIVPVVIQMGIKPGVPEPLTGLFAGSVGGAAAPPFRLLLDLDLELASRWACAHAANPCGREASTRVNTDNLPMVASIFCVLLLVFISVSILSS